MKSWPWFGKAGPRERRSTEIWQDISARRGVGRTTILNLVDRLERRGWLVRRDREKPCHYLAALSREETAVLLAGGFVDDFFAGSASNLVMSLLGSKRLKPGEIERLRQRAGINVQAVSREKGEIAMPGLEAIMRLSESVSYLVNLAVAVSLACGVGLWTARLCRHGSAPLRHGVLLGTLVLVLLSPAAVWLAERNGLALVWVTISSPANAQAASMVDPKPSAELPSLIGRGTGGESVAPLNKRGPDFAGKSPHPNPLPRREGTNATASLLRGEGTGATASSLRSLSAVGGATVVVRKSAPASAWWQLVGSIVALLWAMGTALGLLRLGWGYAALARFCRRLDPLLEPRQKLLVHQAADAVGLRKLPPVFLSRWAGVPVSIGLLRPAIVLPEGMPRETNEDQLQAVLLHEMAHIARHDHWVGVGQRMAAVLFWWNPLVHWACDEISDLREEICDNYVVLVQGEGQRLARILVDLAARVGTRPLLPSTIGALEPRLAGLTGRVTRLLDKERNMETRMNLRSKVLVFACGLAVLIGMASIGGLRLAYAQPAKETKPAAAAEAKPSATDVSKAAKLPGDLAKAVPGAKPSHVTTYHARLFQSGTGMREVWVQLNPDGTPLRTNRLPRHRGRREGGDLLERPSRRVVPGQARVYRRSRKELAKSRCSDAEVLRPDVRI